MGISETIPVTGTGTAPAGTYQQQLEYLMRRFGDRVLYLAYSYLHDRYLAEDIAQEVFIRVYTHLGKFQGRSSIYTWIYRITVNLCRDYLRAQNRRYTEPRGALVAIYPDVEDIAINNLQYRELWQAILNLPLAYREVIWLHYYEQLSLKDIAVILGVSPATAKIRLYRARQKLQRALLKGGGPDE